MGSDGVAVQRVEVGSEAAVRRSVPAGNQTLPVPLARGAFAVGATLSPL